MVEDRFNSIPLLPSLRCEEIERIEEAGAVRRAIYLYGDLLGHRVKVFAWLGVPARPEASKLPALLHIHGGSQTADAKQVSYWAERGYLTLSYDWSGPIRGRDRYSDLAGLPNSDPKDELRPERSVMFTRVAVAKLMLGWLASLPETDADRLGAYGISWGGSILWLLNAYDDRLRGAAPVYGCGRPLGPSRHKRYERLAHTADDLQAWSRELDGAELAERQHAPIYMFAATNDFWGWMDAVCESVAKLPKRQRSLTFAVNANHHLDRWAALSMEHWFDYRLKGNGLWPAMPEAQLHIKDGRLWAGVKAFDVMHLDQWSARVCWSWGDEGEAAPVARYWHTADIRWGDETEIPVVRPEMVGLLYVDLISPNGLKLSSMPLRFSPRYTGAVQPTGETSAVLARFRTGDANGWFYGKVGRTEPMDPPFPYGWAAAPDGGEALTFTDSRLPFLVATRKLIDPTWSAPSLYAAIEALVFTPAHGRWAVEVMFRPEQAGQRSWTMRQEREAGWSTLRITREALRDERGNPLPAWELANMISIGYESDSDSPQPALGTVLWKNTTGEELERGPS